MVCHSLKGATVLGVIELELSVLAQWTLRGSSAFGEYYTLFCNLQLIVVPMDMHRGAGIDRVLLPGVWANSAMTAISPFQS